MTCSSVGSNDFSLSSQDQGQLLPSLYLLGFAYLACIFHKDDQLPNY